MIREVTMNRIRKLLTVLCIIISLLIVNINTFAFESKYTFEDESIQITEFMKAFDIFPDNINLDDNITREMAAYALSSITGSVGYDGEIFTDVKSDNVYKADIDTAYIYKLMIGVGNGKFLPKEPLTYEQAVSIMVTLAGYRTYAEMRGGAFIDYLNVGIQNKIFTSFDKVRDDALTGTEFSNMLYHALESEYLDVESVSDGSTIYNKSGKSVMDKYMHIEKLECTLQSVDGMSISKQYSSDIGYAVISSKTYKNEFSQCSDYLGDKIYAYVSDDNIIKYVCPCETKKRFIHIDAEDILTFTEKEITYESKEKNRDEKIRMDGTQDIMINNVPLSHAVNYKTIIPDYGYIQACDYDDDNIYELIKIHSYELCVVGSIDTKNMKITDKYSRNTIEFAPDNINVNCKIFLNDDEVVIDKLYSGMILLMERSEVFDNMQIIRIYASEKKVSGFVNSISGDKKTLTVSNEEYDVNPLYIKAAETYDGVTKINGFSNATLYLDSNGYIASIDYEKEKLSYGYLFNAGVDNNTLDKRFMVKLLTSDSEFKTFYFADVVRFNGKSLKSENLVGNSNIFSGAKVIRGVVRYNLDNNGRIGNFVTNYDSNEYERLTIDGHTAKRTIRNNRFVDSQKSCYEFFIDSSTVIFNIPVKDEDIDNESKYGVENIDNLPDDAEISAVTPYNIDNNGIAGAITLSQPNRFMSTYYPAIVSETGIATNPKGEIDSRYIKAYIYSNNKEQIFYIDDDVYNAVGELKCGDLVQFSYNYSRDKITNINVCFQYEKNKSYYFDSSKTFVTNASTGYVEYVDYAGGNRYRVNFNNDFNGDGVVDYRDYRYIWITSSTQVYIVDDKNIKKASSSDLNIGDKIVYYNMNANVYMLIIYRNVD